MRFSAIFDRHQFSSLSLGLLVVGLIFTAVTLGCVTSGAGVSSEGATVKVTPLPVSDDNSTPAGADEGKSSSTEPQRNTVAPGLAGTSTPDPNTRHVDTELSLNLTILAPTQGSGLEVGAIRVLGVTLADAEVTINGLSAEVNPDGSFTRDLILGEGINSVEAIAKNDSGQEVSEVLVVLFVPRTQGVPLSILFPQGLEVSDPDLTIMGVTRPDAVVGVNGVPVEINGLGIFSTSVVLEEGTNLVEVVAVDLKENVNFQTVVVFYIP